MAEKPLSRSPNAPLNRKQLRFVSEYILDLDATKAAVRAGYRPTTGFELMKKPRILRAIDEAMYRRQIRTEIKADDVIVELYNTAFSDLRQIFNEDGSLKAIHEIPEEVARAISSIEVDELFEGRGEDKVQIGFTKKIKFWDKLKGLELLGKHLKLYTDRVEHAADSSFAEILKAARERSASK